MESVSLNSAVLLLDSPLFGNYCDSYNNVNIVLFQQVQSENEGFLSEDSRFATKAIHSGYKPGAYGSWAIIPPICMSTTFKQTGPAEPVVKISVY